MQRFRTSGADGLVSRDGRACLRPSSRGCEDVRRAMRRAAHGRPSVPRPSCVPGSLVHACVEEKTSLSRVRVSSRSTCCRGAASSRSPPACRACSRTRTSAARPLESMNSSPVRSMMMSRSRAATVQQKKGDDSGFWTCQPGGREATPGQPRHRARIPSSDRRVMFAAEDSVSQRRAVAVGAGPADQVLLQAGL